MTPTTTRPTTRPKPELRFVALGDSVTVGLGDLTDEGWRGWSALLAQALASAYQLSYANLASEGATTRQVLHDQLPTALGLRPQLASVVVGVNDAMRSTFDPRSIRADLVAVAADLTRAGADLLTVRFHDHGRVFGLPPLLRGPLARRIEAVNAVYDEIHAKFGGTYVDLAAWPEVYTRAAWSVDRLHPSERGHRQLARSFAERMPAAGFGVPVPALETGGGVVPSRAADLGWMLTKGIPWVGRRMHDLGPWAARMACAEVIGILRRHAQGRRRQPVGSR